MSDPNKEVSKGMRNEVADITASVASGMSMEDQKKVWLTAQARDLIEARMEDAGHRCPDSGQMMVEPFDADFGIEIDGHIYGVTIRHRKAV